MAPSDSRATRKKGGKLFDAVNDLDEEMMMLCHPGAPAPTDRGGAPTDPTIANGQGISMAQGLLRAPASNQTAAPPGKTPASEHTTKWRHARFSTAALVCVHRHG